MTWRFFPVEVRALRRLGPSFLRVTFTGPELDRFADNGYDQRLKLALPESAEQLAHLPNGADWFQRWRGLPPEWRSPIRTYTVRALRPALRELDVDLVLHENEGGPASRWARSVAVGDRIAVLGPEAGFDGDHGGIGFRPPPDTSGFLLAGDETAVPALCAIVERLPADATGEVLLEVPYPEDVQHLDGPAGVAVSWLVRGAAEPGRRLVPAVQAAAARLTTRRIPQPAPGRVYAWLAGEAAMITTLRRFLIGERGFTKDHVAFMGYWRLGRSDATAA
jgi:NADPH-dependent ferric siderophore reductase